LIKRDDQLSISRGNYQKTKDKKDFFSLGNLGKDDLTEETADKYQEFELSESMPKISDFKLKKIAKLFKAPSKKIRTQLSHSEKG
jgi:hypothetical protein